MADMTAAQVAEWMAAQGLKVPADVLKRAESEKNDETETYLYERLSTISNETDRIAAAQESREFFETVAANMLSFDGQEKNRPGRGNSKVFERHVGIETAAGFLKVTLQVPVK
jgi:hypothetical protein